METKINWLAIVIIVVATMLLGFLWYGLLFQEQWMAGNGFTMEGEKMFKNGVEVPMSATPMIFNTIAMVVYALAMNWFLGRMGVNTWMDGAKTGAVVGLIMFVGVATGHLFANNPFSLTLVDGLYSLVLFTLIGAILGGMTKS
ncbi:MAG: DUF1761 domain-containing protein [Saprospiraceae bacterium]|nr:DUF1761 domain-containing protein [Saprospiraceae bacterium]